MIPHPVNVLADDERGRQELLALAQRQVLAERAATTPAPRTTRDRFKLFGSGLANAVGSRLLGAAGRRSQWSGEPSPN